MLVLETWEEMPTAQEVFRILRNMGERGLLAGFPAVLVGRAKAWDFDRPHTIDGAAGLAPTTQREAVSRALADYAADAVVVFDVDLGHTDPQLIIPYGGRDPGRRGRAPHLGALLTRSASVGPPARGQASTTAKARTGKVPMPATLGGAAVKRKPVGGSASRPVRCSTIGMPAASRSAVRRASPAAAGLCRRC